MSRQETYEENNKDKSVMTEASSDNATTSRKTFPKISKMRGISYSGTNITDSPKHIF